MSSDGNITAPPTPDLIESTGLKNFTQDQINRSVYITNISEKATLKNVSDFFSFCGEIERIIINRHPEHGGNQFSVVLFEDESAFSTALLLGNAVIVDQPITVVAYSSVAPRSEVEPIFSEAGASSADRTAAGPVSATSAIAGLIAKGYITGETAVKDLRKQAHALDEQTNMSSRLNMAYDISMAKAKEFDDTIQLTNKFNAFSTNVKQSLDEFEDQYHLRAQTEAVVKSVRDTTMQAANDLTQKALEIEPIKQGWDWLSGGWSSLASTVTGIQKETEENIAKYKGAESSSGVSDSSGSESQAPPQTEGSSDGRGSGESNIYPELNKQVQESSTSEQALQKNNEENDIVKSQPESRE